MTGTPKRRRGYGELFLQVPVDLAASDSVDRARIVLGLSTAEAIGYLVLLYAEVLKAKAGGRVLGRSDAWLEEAVRWRGEPGAWARFVRAELADPDEPELLAGYLDTYGQLEQRWAADRERKRRDRQLAASEDVDRLPPGTSADDRPTEGGTSADIPRTFRGTSADPSSSSSSSSSSARSGERRDDGSPGGEGAGRGGAADGIARRLDLAAFGRYRDDVEGLLRSSRSPAALAAVLARLMDGEVTPDPYTPAEVGEAASEYLADSSRPPGTFNARHFAGFCRRVRRARQLAPQRAAHDRHLVREVRLEREREEAKAAARRAEQEAARQVERFAAAHPERFAELRRLAEREVPGEGSFRDAAVAALVEVKVLHELKQGAPPTSSNAGRGAVAC